MLPGGALSHVQILTHHRTDCNHLPSQLHMEQICFMAGVDMHAGDINENMLPLRALCKAGVSGTCIRGIFPRALRTSGQRPEYADTHMHEGNLSTLSDQ